jgi:glycosyltransferase involved in cell wall biosynthesis
MILDELLDDPERRKTMSEAGRARIEDSLSWEHSVPHLLNAYQRATGSPRPVGHAATTH